MMSEPIDCGHSAFKDDCSHCDWLRTDHRESWGTGDFLDRRAARLTLLESDGRYDQAEEIARRTVRMANGIEHGMEGNLVNPSDYSTSARSIRYVNAGDTYTGTLVRKDPDGVWVWSTWGDEYERAEENYAIETETARCPQCGEWSAYVDHDSDRGECCGAINPADIDLDDVLEGAATALFASAYASECEAADSDDDEHDTRGMLQGQFGEDYPTAGAGEDWLDIMPDIPESATVSARALLVKVAGLAFAGAGLPADSDMILRGLCAEWKSEGGTGDRFGSADWIFGYYLAMESLGHGVGLSDDLPAASRYAVETPMWEYCLWS